MPFRRLGDPLFSRGLTGRVAGSGVGVSSVPWYLSGNIPAANCVAAYKPKNAADLASSYINLANPGTNNAAPGASGPTWNAANGWIFPASGTAILTTGITIAANSWTVLVRCVIGGNGGGAAGRLYSACADTFYTIPFLSTTSRLYTNGGAGLSIAGTLSGAHVLGVANNKAYLDGAAETGTITLGGLAAGALTIGNRASDLARQIHANIQAMVVYNATLSADQVAAVTAAMNNL